ncbi:TetR/AcrR family transcriptional regulator [Agromyces cerinus]|uniref:TetR/AcrR family transcriptional regulator n=1 Tax=Agromyces cerinus TaxID=33878 RepID=UPI00135629B9|nr:TetR/AcrR family transcriptional regulator [Agromyces cerinus]
MRTAGVSRSSFYTHFAGIEEVGVAALRSILDSFDPIDDERDPGAPGAPAAASFQDLFDHLAAHRDLCVAVLVSDEQMPALAELHAALVTHVTTAIERSPAMPAGFDVERGARFLVGGILSLLHEDLQTGADIDGTGAIVSAMLPEWLARDNLLDAPLSVAPSSLAPTR